MTQNTPPGWPPFDPSKMDPKLLMELSQLIQQLPPQQLNRLQTLMHNMMAGIDVRRELEEFEKSLPPGFRDKLMALMASNPSAFVPSAAPSAATSSAAASPAAETGIRFDSSMDLREARLTILRAVAEGRLTPEEAERLLFGT